MKKILNYIQSIRGDFIYMIFNYEYLTLSVYIVFTYLPNYNMLKTSGESF
jgi:hypothetical protein